VASVWSEVAELGPLEHRLRRAVNPISTGLTRWWCGGPRRQVPHGSALGASEGTAAPRALAFRAVPSPGEWVAPAGQRPGWQWLPEHGARPNLRAVPRWVRVWYRTPFLDRYAYEWMWWHGGWNVLVPGEPPPPPQAGVREPRGPTPVPRSTPGIIDETPGETIS
jgi:hypothetical protein